MTIRTFRGFDGFEWTVYTTLCADDDASPPQEWLTFSSGVCRRRLRPVPSGWATAPHHRLEQMCRIAEPAGREHVVAELASVASGVSDGTPPSPELDDLAEDRRRRDATSDGWRRNSYEWAIPRPESSYRG